jgi:hypothetical protein
MLRYLMPIMGIALILFVLLGFLYIFVLGVELIIIWSPILISVYLAYDHYIG